MASSPKYKLTVLLPSAIIFLLLIVMIHVAVNSERQSIRERVYADISQTAVARLARLEVELYANAYVSTGLVALINASGEVVAEDLQSALKSIYERGLHIRNIGLAPNNRITYVYPKQGNEAAIGLYYPDHPMQWPAVKKAIDSRSAVLAGPVTLRQGGLGVINRTPVFLDSGDYWGLMSIVLDLDELLQAAGLMENDGNIRLALRGTDGKGVEGSVFFGDPGLFEMESTRLDLEIPGGSWQLAAYPVSGWERGQSYLDMIEVGAIMLCFLMMLAQLRYQAGMAKLAENEHKLRFFLDTSRDGVIVIDRNGKVVEFNPAAEQLFGYSAEDMKGASVNHLMPEDVAQEHNKFVKYSRANQPRNMAPGRQVMGRRKDGSEFPVEITVGQAASAQGRMYVGVVRDISERKAYEDQLIELASTDSLTGAFNRRAFLAAAEDSFRRARRYGTPLSLLNIDVDYFKRINDNYGHAAGDQVLVNLVDLFRRSFRETDKIGRFGGEEFLVLLPETDLGKAAEAAERLLETVRNNTEQLDDGRCFTYTISIGIAAVQPDSDDFETIINTSDEALYQAKQTGRNRYCVAEQESPLQASS